MRVSIGLLLVVGVLSGLVASPRSTAAGVDDSRTVLGEWVGTYTCAQGLTGLTLTIAEATPNAAQALFHYYADPRNPRVPTGCFMMDGRYDPASSRLRLDGRTWLLRPSGYRLVSFDGEVDAAGSRFEGKVTGAQAALPGCTTFRLERVASPAPRPEHCVLPDPPAAQPDHISAGAIADALVGAGRIDLNILFAFAQATIRADGARQLDELGRILLSPPLAGRRIGILGHTDAAGSAALNRRLSEARAAAVRDYLVQHFGEPAARFEVRGFGKDQLRLPDAPRDEANRRVEIVVLD